ncbi:alkene reductase [Pseudomonas brassicacearum]|jgi:NADH:flavin oxidoreductases, Old Yellow Enzyme family|uniref:alkene reductase n=1 Tax=Pseudomonas brassicacearum TaxID=930166 RepID=UPI00025FFED5|nr:alkene reductase [Pseudomonas brassicacearum]EIK64618.1 N-ethylmaleimide reductase [Pseudomonas fluorescens Q8r1-96]KAB0528204.1 alkene reductase [Pseudomonas brassicacearum subsp. brassicacearum]NJP59595.1 alkene reductase [Pseudomonas brassicacearum]QEO78273.1 alkene reductase [Pseudomonas brassicacearum]SDP32928.1 N-ethylmaleimide reductase [Pseudomonas brassicacearum]
MTDQILFTPYTLGDLTLSNRVVLAPLTRNRAGQGFVPSEFAATYYSQRASAGLLISEASQISQQGQGYQDTPGIYTQAQIDGWRTVTEAVHAKGGRIFLQLWHVGRVSHVDLQANGAAPVAPSALRPATKVFVNNSFEDVSEPRALDISELPGIVNDFRQAAANAIAAGFDGVEIHGANGYLLDQFIKDGANLRTDAYGGSIENRARLLLEVTAAVVDEVGANRTGLRISPVSPANGVSSSEPQAQFDYLVDQLNALDIVYLHVVEGATGGPRDVAPFDFGALRQRFKKTYIANNGYDLDLATSRLAEDKADLIAFGRPFIGNPDLVERLRTGSPLSAFNPATLYGGGATGYIDYPTLAESSTQ